MGRFWLLVLFVAGCERDERPQDPRPEQREVAVLPPAPAAAPKPPPKLTSAPQQKGPTSHMSKTAARIADLDRFSLGGEGFAGAEGEGETLMRKLVKEKQAIAMLDQLSASPNRVAQLFAYWALRKLDPARADVLRVILVKDTTPVEILEGCVGSFQPTNAIVAQIDNLPQSPLYQVK